MWVAFLFFITVYGFQNNLATPTSTLLTSNAVNTHSGTALQPASHHEQLLLKHNKHTDSAFITSNDLSSCVLQDTVCRKTFLRASGALVLLVQEFLLLQVFIMLTNYWIVLNQRFLSWSTCILIDVIWTWCMIAKWSLSCIQAQLHALLMMTCHESILYLRRRIFLPKRRQKCSFCQRTVGSSSPAVHMEKEVNEIERIIS